MSAPWRVRPPKTPLPLVFTPARSALCAIAASTHDRLRWSAIVAAAMACWLLVGGFSCTTAAAQATRTAKETDSSTNPPIAATGDRTIVAQVNEQPIYKGEIDQALANALKGNKVEGAILAEYQAALLEQLIKNRLLLDFIARTEELKPTSEEIQNRLDEIRAELKSRGGVSLERYARENGMTMAGFKSRVANEVGMRKFLQRYSQPQTIEAYFKRHGRHFDGTQVRVSHILLRPKGSGDPAETRALRAQALQLKADIEAGKLIFADAARQFSAGPSRKDGGDLGFIGRKGPMVGEFSKAAFDLEQGKISDPVITSFGVHLITVTEIKPGEKSLELVRDEVMPAFSQWLVDELIERELKTAKIEFNPSFPHYKPGTRELAGVEK